MLGLVKQMVKPLASQTPDAGQIPALRVLGYSALYSRPVLPAFVGVSYLSVRHVFLVKHLYSALDSGTAQPRIREPFYSACGPVCASIVKHRRRRPNTRFAGAWLFRSILRTCAACFRRRFVPFGTAQVRR